MVLGIRARVSFEHARQVLCGTGLYYHPELRMNFKWEKTLLSFFPDNRKAERPLQVMLVTLWVAREGAGEGKGTSVLHSLTAAAANCPLWRRALQQMSAFLTSFDLAVLPPRIYFVATFPCI